jgi:hypothetical protein
MSRYQPVLRGARAIWIAALLLFACRSRPAAVEVPFEALARQGAVCADLAATVDDTVPAAVPADVQPLPDDARVRPPSLRLALNIPAYRLDVYVSGELDRSFPVAVGMPQYPTRTGRFAVMRVVWNPWWQPPASDWAKGKRLTPPGPTNPMGRVKLLYQELYFLHGTPATGSIGTAASHGCVRLANADAIALARAVHQVASPDVAESLIDELVASPSRTRVVPLQTPVPLDIDYRLAEVRGDQLSLYPDIYRHGPEAARRDALAALGGAGYSAVQVDAAALDAFVAAPRQAEVIVAVSSLLLPHESPPEPATVLRPEGL